MVCLAKQSGEEALPTRMESAELAQRLAFYRKWFESVLALADGAKATFSDQIKAIEARALAGGYAKRDEGRITPIRRIRTNYTQNSIKDSTKSRALRPTSPF